MSFLPKRGRVDVQVVEGVRAGVSLPTSDLEYLERDYVEEGFGGVTELRVHGVSGTPPEALLEHPHTRRLAGDADAGFYRRVWESPLTSQDGRIGDVWGIRRREGYYWGGLTSRAAIRALYLLLLPFLLVNAGFYATPRSPIGEEGTAWSVVRGVSEAAQRLLALSLTLTMTLGIVEASVDIVGWQCGRATTSCGGLLAADWSWLKDDLDRRIAVTALVPLAVIALLWWLGRLTWLRGEVFSPPSADPEAEQTDWASKLEGRAFWNGMDAVAGLRALHITGALTLVGLAVMTPTLPSPASGLSVLWSRLAWERHWWSLALILVFVVLLIVSAVGVLLPKTARRAPPKEPTSLPRNRVRGWRTWRSWRTWLPIATLVLVLAAGCLLAFGGAAAPVDRPSTMLPWLAWSISAVFWVQAGLVVVITALTLWQSRGVNRSPAPADTLTTSPAWRGLALPAMHLMGWMLGGGLAAALVLRVADIVGSPIAAIEQRTTAAYEATTGVTRPAAAKQILVPVGYFWASAAATLILLITIASVLVVLVGVWVAARRRRSSVSDAYRHERPPNGATEDARSTRASSIARTWADAAAPDVARRVAGWSLTLASAVLLAGVLGYLVQDDLIVSDITWAPPLLLLGNLIMTGAVVGLLYLGRVTTRNPSTRRLVGILWDVGTFWPRATHPLAPPSYGERAVPDLLTRIEALTAEGTRPVVLSCHSQGCVIGAAVVSASRYPVISQTALLTYGDPLRRLYSRFFPAYFGVAQLERLGHLLQCGENAPKPNTAPLPTRSTTSAAQRSAWPWRNLQRPSDPVGGLLFVPKIDPRPGPVDLDVDVDVELLDPSWFWPRRGDTAWPAARRHSDYPWDSDYHRAVLKVIELRM
jgi:hypothetical protein